MKKSIIIISSILTVALVAGSVFASGPGKKSGKGQSMGYNQQCPGYGGQNALNNLSQEQKDEFFALRQKFIDESYEFRSSKFVKQQEMRMLMETSNPDRAKLEKLSDKITKLQQQIRNKRIDFQLAAKKIAPELSMGRGFGQGHGKGFKRGGQRDCQGQGQRGYNCQRYNN
jgi:zinc resistance-associated protein